MNKIRVGVPGHPDQYVEIRNSRGAEIAQEWEPKGSYFRLRARGFDEAFIVRGTFVIRLSCDVVAPDHVLSADGIDRSSRLEVTVKKKTQIEMTDTVELQLHLSTPLAPHDYGVWVKLMLEDKNGLRWGAGFPKEDSTLTLPAADPSDVDKESSNPDWFDNPNARWTVKVRGKLAADNTLMSHVPSRALGNLLALDPGRKAAKSEASLSLFLQPDDAEFVLCTELALAPSFVSGAPVSGYALRLHSDSRSSAPFAAHDLILQCQQRGPRDGWNLTWLNVPGSLASAVVRKDGLALESLTQALFNQHSPGLATVRSRNRLSFIPSRVRSADAKATVTLKFEVEADATLRPKSTRLTGIVLTPSSRRIELFLDGALDKDNRPLKLEVLAEPETDNQLENCDILARWVLLPAGDVTLEGRLGVGSVLLALGQFLGGSLQVGLAPLNDYGRETLVSYLRLELRNAKYSALSMDPELGFEALSADTNRTRPWTFDLTGEQACDLQVLEQASQARSRYLHLELKLPEAGSRETDVVLVDPSPLTIVRLRTKETQKGSEILAEYIDDADQAPEWRFYSFEGTMSATLPPQGIGEEMIKGNLHLTRNGSRVRVPADGQLFDFRLTAPARLTLDRTDINTARSEAPWSLRRLLGRRLGTTGLKLDRAEFELLYGLSAKVQSTGLRIAELDGFIGRVPYNEELRRAKRSGKKSVKAEQGRKASEWISALWQRPSWWRIYADLADRSKLTINDVEFRLRRTRQTAHPFEIGRYATEDGEVQGREPLRGGVDWPFQSRNIYDELEPTKPTRSSQGSVEGLVFGALGGEGAQTAAFNNGKTLIISSSSQGRLDSLTLIRVGRIAMLWNKARHVIVYERTTRRVERYEEDIENPGWDPDLDDLEVQPPFKGLAALRKVREYVEITEPRRSYPDSRAARPICGPLTQSVFSTVVIPVRSDWGRDIPNGFAIALRGPIPPTKEAYFPDPQVFLDFARASEKGGGSIGQRIVNTKELVFFTSTRKDDGGDTDLWPAWPEIDFPLIRPAAPPKLPFASSFSGRDRQPDAAPIELGMAPFTFKLEPAEEAANVMHARPVKGIETKIVNINLARGLPATAPPMTSPGQQQALAASVRIGEMCPVVLDGLAELRSELAERLRHSPSAKVENDPQFTKDVGALLSRLREAVVANGTGLPTPASDGRTWSQLQEDRLTRYRAGVSNEAERLKEQLQRQALSSDLEAARGNASAILDVVSKQAQQRIGEVGYVPSQAIDAVGTALQSVAARLGGGLLAIAAEAVQLIDDIERRHRQAPDSAAALDLLWREFAEKTPGRLRSLLQSLPRLLEEDLSTWFSRLPTDGSGTIYDTAETPAAKVFEGVVDWFSRWSDSIAPFDIGAPDFNAMREVLSKALSGELIDEALGAARLWLKEKLPDVEQWSKVLDDQVEELRKWEKALAQQIAAAVDVDALQSLLSNAALDLAKTLGEVAKVVENKITTEMASLKFLDIQGSLSGLKDFEKETRDRLDAIGKALTGSIAELEEAVNANAGEIEKRVQAAGKQVEDWVSKEVGAVYQVAKENIDSGLEALRLLAEGPVTEITRTTRELIAYYPYQSEVGILVTRASAVFNQLPGDVLNALQVKMPFDSLVDRLKASVGGMLVRDLFPSIAGLDMTYLLPDLNVPLEGDEQYEWLRLQHGFDKDRLRAWAKVTIDKRFDSDATLFDLGPVKLRLLRPLFAGTSDIIIEKDGSRTTKTEARLNADFQLSLNDQPMVTLQNGTLSFDESGKLDFDLDPDRIELAPELQFITDAIKAWKPEIDGFTLIPLLPGGVSTSLCLPLPDIGTGAFTMTGITLNTHFDLRIAEGFEISTGLWLSKPDRPFGLAVLFLGGGGWFGIDATYRPPARFLTRVSIGISAGAFIALNFGFAGGSAGILFTASVDFYRDWEAGKGSTAISLGILIWGEFSVMGIASASIRIVLRVTYKDGSMVGNGQFSVSIKICWCYTLRVNRSVRKQFAGKSSDSQRSSARSATLLTTAGTEMASAETVQTRSSFTSARASPRRVDPKSAVEAYLKTLAIVSP